MTTKKPENCPQNLWDRYCIYAKCAADLNWKIKTFNEWVNS